MSDQVKTLKLKVLNFLRDRPGLADSVQELFLELFDALEAVERAGCAGSCARDNVQDDAPAVGRESLVNALGAALANAYEDDSVVTVEESVAGQLLASGILQDAAEVEARGLEKLAHSTGVLQTRRWLNAIAQQVREGN